MKIVACGLFGIAEDFTESNQSLDELFVKNKTSTFFFKAMGQSMEPTICAGDVLVVDRSLEKYHGRVCVLAYEGKLICKRIFSQGSRIILKSDNSNFKSLELGDSESFIFWGVVIARVGEVR